MKTKTRIAAIGAAFLATLAGSASAAPIIWVSDQNGNIGQVDVATQSVVAGSVHNTGQSLTDIAFNSAGTLYGTTFTGLYTVNTGTGAATLVGNYSGVTGMNALIGNGTNLLGAAANTNTIYAIGSSNAALTTFNTGTVPSAGDLAFAAGTLYESAVLGASDELYDVTTHSAVGVFHVGSTTGPTLNDVFSIADDGTVMYGIAGTEVYSVNLANAVLTPLFDYSTHENGQSLVANTGAAFFNEATTGRVPEPASSSLLGLGALALLVARRKARR
jgi:hypothetical protein